MEMCLIERLDTSIEEGEKKLRDTVVITVSFIFEKGEIKCMIYSDCPKREEREMHEKTREIKYASISWNIQMMNIL